MDANSFIAKLKANGSEKDNDLDKVFEEYQSISSKLPTKDKGTFALNALCVLCRNLDKCPQWRNGIDHKSLLVLSIECVRGTRNLDNADRVKTLACIYHIHRHMVTQTSHIPPELVLKFSYMPFECDNSTLLVQYYKTYWSILVERLTYIEKLRSNKMSIAKLLPKLTEDLIRVIEMYDSVQFCTSLLVFTVKKLYYIFNDSAKELAEVFVKIFNVVSKDSSEGFKRLSEKETSDLYVKFNECFVIITENAAKISFRHFNLDIIVRNCIKMLGHCSDIFHCLQTFQINGFCCVFNEKMVQDSGYVETILKNLVVSCETGEKLGYKATMYATYPFMNQFLKIYIENKFANQNGLCEDFGGAVQVSCLKLMILLIRKLKITNQFLKCDNCSVRSGLHDALRLSFLVKNFISTSVAMQIDLKMILPYYKKIVETQYQILYELRALGCSNFDKCFRKLQTDIHNTAITLNKAQYYEYSIKTFDVYLINELKNLKSESELRNISRGLYNKSICELDCKLHEQALKDAYLSLVFGNTEPSTEKYMSLVMDIKAKMLKIGPDGTVDEGSVSEENQDYFQMMTALDATKILLENNSYGDLKPFIRNLKFSNLLKHEFLMYVKLWPSIVPIAGVWRSLYDMVKDKNSVCFSENSQDLLKLLYEIVLKTPSVVRTIHSHYYKEIILELAENLREKSMRNVEEDIILATLLFLKTEYDLTEASEKYSWKISENTVDPDQGQAIRTIPQEHHAMRSAVEAVGIWTNIQTHIQDVDESNPVLHDALEMAQIFVHQFMHMQNYVHGLQLACICCEVALHLDDKESYIRNAGIIISYTEGRNDFLDNVIKIGTKFVTALFRNEQSLEACLTYMCDLALYYNKLELVGVSARLLHFVQLRILEAYKTQQNVSLDLSVGRLMEAQFELLGERESVETILTSVNNIQRHYVAISNSGTTYTTRRLRSASLKYRSASSGDRATAAAFSLRLYRRARAAAAATLPRAAALTQASLYCRITNVANVEDTQVKIDNRLKHILGLQPTNETQPSCLAQASFKHEVFTPKTENLETMLDCVFKRTQTSPSQPCITIPGFKMPEFLNHCPNCACYACQTLECDFLAFQISSLEASMFFRAKEFDIARNYYDGAFKILDLAEGRLKSKLDLLKSRKFDENILEIVASVYRKEMREMTIEFLIDASLFELAQGFYEKSDDHVVRIHEILTDIRTVDPYIKNELYNMMVASARLRNVVKTPELGLEIDFENLKLSPDCDDIPKTPETKFVPAKPSALKIVKPEELPNVKRKVIKLNLDDNLEDEVKPQKPVKKHNFKVPIPVTSKPVLENMTPRPKPKPDITVTQPGGEDTPRVNEFFTPQSTPSHEQFFTPISTVKTYSKRAVVKNLEAEFATPKSNKKPLIEPNVSNELKSETKRGGTKIKVVDESSKKGPKGSKVETGSMRTLREKRSLRRATSPGKLVEDKAVTRSRRRNVLEDGQ